MNRLDPVLAEAHSLQGAQGRFTLIILRLDIAVCLSVIIKRLWSVYLVLPEENNYTPLMKINVCLCSLGAGGNYFHLQNKFLVSLCLLKPFVCIQAFKCETLGRFKAFGESVAHSVWEYFVLWIFGRMFLTVLVKVLFDCLFIVRSTVDMP